MAFCLLYEPAFTTVHDHWEDHSLDYMDLCWQSNVSAFQHTVYVCHRFPVEKQNLLISWLQLPSAVIFRAQEEEICHYFHHPPSICHEVMGLDVMILVGFFFLIFSFKLALSLFSFTLIKRFFSSCLLSDITVVSSAYLSC